MPVLDETLHVENVTPVCPWCDEPLDGPLDGPFHQRCAVELTEELEGCNDCRE